MFKVALFLFKFYQLNFLLINFKNWTWSDSSLSL